MAGITTTKCVCVTCNKEFEVPAAYIRFLARKGYVAGRFCSVKCRGRGQVIAPGDGQCISGFDEAGNGRVFHDNKLRRISVVMEPGTFISSNQARDLAAKMVAAADAVDSGKPQLAGEELPGGTLVSREEARACGRTRFFTGKPCGHGHIAERMVSNMACIICLRLHRMVTPEKCEKERKRTIRLQRSTPEKRKTRNRKERTRKSGKLARVLRNRINLAVKNGNKGGSAVRDLGCSLVEFKAYLESLWQPGMTWENYGIKGWHLDHILPLAAFDLSDRKQFLVACNWRNYQPLWAIANYAKSDKLYVGPEHIARLVQDGFACKEIAA